jgi:spermidine synthase
VVIAESHLSFHTWPEHGYIAIDYFTCGEEVDIHLTIDLMERALGPDHSERTMHWRGEELAGTCDARPKPGFGQRPETGPPGAPAVSDIAGERERWVTEYHLDPASGRRELGFQYLVVRDVHRRRSPIQDIRVVEGTAYGRMLLLDGAMMTTERDEFVYHEMLAHIPLLLHPSPRRICIVGGGDGGLLREVLRHGGVEAVDLVELDPEVIAVCREYLPEVASRFDDPRVTVHAEDGARFLSRSEGRRFDAVLVDSTDPVGAAKALFEEPFYREARRCLTPDGVFATQALSPWCQAAAQERMFSALGRAFGRVRAYHATVPTYPGGMWLFAIARLGELDLEAFDLERALCISDGCRYYTPALQVAAFHLPAFVRKKGL